MFFPLAFDKVVMRVCSFHKCQRLLPGEPGNNGGKGFQVLEQDAGVRKTKAFTVGRHLFADLVYRPTRAYLPLCKF